MKRFLLLLGLIAAIAIPSLTSGILPSRVTETTLDPALTHTVTRGELLVTITEQGTLESSNNTEVKCKVRGDNTIIWVVENGEEVEPGDELVRLDTLLIEEEISERTKFAHLAQATVARAQADVAKAELAISEYLEGRFVSELASLRKELAVAESNLRSAKNMLAYSSKMADSGYKNQVDVEEKEFAVSQADLQVQLTNTKIDVLQQFAKREELATLRGNLNAAKAKLEAEEERLRADQHRKQRAEDEFGQCVVKAKRRGIVIYPTGEDWEDAPNIEEGATVHKDQVLLLMPDLTQMQVKVGIHESVIDTVRPGMRAAVTVAGKTLEGEIASVASVAKPAGWWTGNVVKYDTIIQLPNDIGLKPGMSVEVKIITAQHEDILKIPTSAILETHSGHICWIRQDDQLVRRDLQLGDSSELFAAVQVGLSAGDQVVIDPLANVPEAQQIATAMIEKSKQPDAEQAE